jgi:hypothetical protein
MLKENLLPRLCELKMLNMFNVNKILLISLLFWHLNINGQTTSTVWAKKYNNLRGTWNNARLV